MAAFRYSIELKVDFIETDVRLSADGHAVLIHSEGHIEETTDGVGAISDLTLAEIRQLDAGTHFSPVFSGESVPTLADLLALSRGRVPILLDTSGDADYYELVLREIAAADMFRQVLIGVRSVQAVDYLRGVAPEVALLSLGYPEERAMEISDRGTNALRFWGCWPSLIARARTFTKPVWVMAGAPNKRDGGKTHPEEVRQWAAAGAAAVILDNPRLLSGGDERSASA